MSAWTGAGTPPSDPPQHYPWQPTGHLTWSLPVASLWAAALVVLAAAVVMYIAISVDGPLPVRNRRPVGYAYTPTPPSATIMPGGGNRTGHTLSGPRADGVPPIALVLHLL